MKQKNERFPIMECVYVIDKQGRKVSYQRIYKNLWGIMQRIDRAVQEHYGKDKETYMNCTILSKKVGLPVNSTLRIALLMMANCRQIISDGKVVRSKPYIVIKQKPKHDVIKYMGMKTAINIFPFDSPLRLKTI